MAANIPDQLKTADISRFAARAAQLEKFKPVISYWCQYYIVQHILSKGLHKGGPECEAYTVGIMGRLEQIKEQHADDDAIIDDAAAQAYAEQFALETFQRADNAIRNNQASAQTADTFRAAATFIDMLTIWTNPLDQEMAAKSKFAKYHALRIAKALKAGEDPNLSNPPPEPVQTPGTELSAPALDPNDPEVQLIQNGTTSAYQPPHVQSVSTSPAQSGRMSPPIPSSRPAPSPMDISTPSQNPHHDVSPLSPDSRKGSTSAASTTSVGGGYFPSVPTFTSETSAPNLPTAPPPHGASIASAPQSPRPSHDYSAPPAPPPSDPASFYAQQPPHSFPPPPPPPPAPAPHQTHRVVPQMQPSAPPPPPQPAATSATQPGFKPDEEAITSAQKHAKWAVSALNFDDVETAIKELRRALADLGAQ